MKEASAIPSAERRSVARRRSNARRKRKHTGLFANDVRDGVTLARGVRMNLAAERDNVETGPVREVGVF
jgi:hypothetical protein